MEIKAGRMISLGYGKFWRSDAIVGLMPIEEQRGPGQRTEVYTATLDGPTDTFMKGDFEPRFTLAGAHKDVQLAVGLAADVGVPVRIARTVLDEMETALSKGFGDRDASIVMTLQEERAGVQISSRRDYT